MGHNSSLEISASGLSAQRQRMDAIANNIANANTTRTAAGTPYRRQQIAFAARADPNTIDSTTPMGVEAPQISEDASPPRLVYDPGHPDADPQGYVAMPNVNIVTEMVDMISATRAYEANVTAMNAAKAMSAKALELGRG